MSDDYVKCLVRMLSLTDKAMLVDTLDDDMPRQQWVPLSTLHAASDLMIASGDVTYGDEFEVKVRAWVAHEKGLKVI